MRELIKRLHVNIVVLHAIPVAHPNLNTWCDNYFHVIKHLWLLINTYSVASFHNSSWCHIPQNHCMQRYTVFAIARKIESKNNNELQFIQISEGSDLDQRGSTILKQKQKWCAMIYLEVIGGCLEVWYFHNIKSHFVQPVAGLPQLHCQYPALDNHAFRHPHNTQIHHCTWYV